MHKQIINNYYPSFAVMTPILTHSAKYVKYRDAISSGMNRILSRQHAVFSNSSVKDKCNIKDKLEQLKASYEDGFTCYKMKDCVFCSSNTSNSLNVFINKTTSDFICHKCKIYGTLPLFGKNFNLKSKEATNKKLDLAKEGSSYDYTHQWKEHNKNFDNIWDLSDAEYKTFLSKFELSNFPKMNFKILNAKINADRNLISFPIYCHNVIVGFKTLDATGDSVTFPKVDCPGVLLLCAEKKSSSLILVGDISDFIALGTLKLPNDVICLPYGIKTLPQNVLPLLEGYEKIYIWLGDKSGAWHSSLLFAKKLMEKRCYLIRPTDEINSAKVAVARGENVKKIILNAKSVWHQCVTTFSSIREDVLAEVQNIVEMSGVPWKRFPQLTKIIKGHRRGEMTILTGPTGCGKTTFLSEYSLDLAEQGVNTLWGSFEVKNSRLARTMLQQFSGIPLNANNLDLFHNWADKFESLPIYFLTFHGQHPINTVMSAIEHCSYTYDIAHVIIDNIQFMMDVSTDESKYLNRFWNQDFILQTFRRFASANNCHVTLVIHPRKETEGNLLGTNSIFGTAKAAQEADNILILQEDPIKKKKFIQVCKNRFSGDLGKMPLIFDKATWSFSQNTTGQNSEKIQSENNKWEALKNSIMTDES